MAFYPYAQVIGAICTSASVRSSTSLSGGFNLPRRRSTGFGYPTNDSWRAHHAPGPKAAGMSLSLRLPPSGVNLAVDQNSLARFSKRTMGRRSALRLLRLHAPSAYNCLVSGSFHLPSGVLCNFRSRYYCAIGLGSYLELEVPASHLPARYPTHGTRDPPNLPSDVPLRGYHPVPRSVPGDFGLVGPGVPGSIHHISSPFRERIRFALGPLRSPLLRASRLISLPPPTKMLQFGGFPLLTERPRRDGKSHSAIPGSQVPCAYPGRIAAWHDLRRRPSQAIPQTAWSTAELTGLTHVQVAYDRLKERCASEATASPAFSTLPR